VTGPRREAVVSENKRYECVSCEGRNGRPGFPATTVPAGTDFVTTVLTSRYPRGRRAGVFRNDRSQSRGPHGSDIVFYDDVVTNRAETLGITVIDQ
jgi:hypothetical protein